MSIEELLNIVKSRHYLVVRRTPHGVSYDVVEHGATLLVLPGDSIKVIDVKIRPLDVPPPSDFQHPKITWIAETIGKPPALKLFQYTFTPLKTRVVQRLDTGAEFHEVAYDERGGPVATLHVVHAYYISYRSNSGRIYSETPGGARAYMLVERGQLKSPQIYIHRHDKHRYEIGVRIPIDEEQVKQVTALLGL